ncbi:MAG: hypothetical protein II969_00550 [Anaerolineaceae bacterium]|nr:hypothetical protein [Anaerolineaceae bacterium]
MKVAIKKILPFLLILIGGIRLLVERFPGRLSFLMLPGTVHAGWIFWTLGFSGVIWLMFRSFPNNLPLSENEKNRFGKGVQKFFRLYGIEAVIHLLTAVSLSMLIRSGYFWDDAVNSTLYLAEKKDFVPLGQHVLEFMQKYLALGRINVLSFYYYFFFYIENVSVYKALIIVSILLNQIIFRNVLRAYDVPLPYARAGMLIIPLLLQTRLYQDPVSGFYSLMQVLTAEMLLCALLLSRWLKSGRVRDLLLCLLVFTIGLMTYEVCFPFLLMVCLLIWVRRGSFQQAFRDSLPFIGVTILLLAGIYLVRAKFVIYTTYAGVAFSLDPGKILSTALKQFTAGLPLSFYTAASQGAVLGNVYPAESFMQYDFVSFLKSIQLSDVLIVAAGIFSLWLIKRQSAEGWGHENGFRSAELLILGFSFAVLPIITVAMSERYQGQLLPGLGYLPVYMQYYGIAALLVWTALKIKISDGVKALVVSAFAVVWLLNLQNNRAVTEIMNRSFYDPRNAGEASLKGGILDFLPQGDILVSLNDRRYLWEANWDNVGLYEEFYGNWSRHKPSVVGDNSLLEAAVSDALLLGVLPDSDGYISISPDNIWLIEYAGGANRGLTRLGRLCYAEVNINDYSVKETETDHNLYFISGVYPEQSSVQYTGADGEFRQIPLAEQLRVRLSDTGILYRLPETEMIRFDSLTLSFASF